MILHKLFLYLVSELAAHAPWLKNAVCQCRDMYIVFTSHKQQIDTDKLSMQELVLYFPEKTKKYTIS